MAKKRDRGKDKKERAPEPPKFAGWKPLAGLDQFKGKLEEEAKKEKERAAAPRPPPRPAPPTRREPARTPGSDADDELSFHRMMMGVQPLDGGKARVPVTSEAKGRPRVAVAELQEKARADAAEVLDHLHRLVDDVARFEVSDDGRRVEGARLDVHPSVLRSLRRGLLPVDATLDLHGLSEADAREKLLQFLRDKRARGERCVLVIHGKGEGILRGEIAAWLSQGRAREHVAAFATARAEDGGEGAVYVALRR
jgi:DNA-nicking Smr family endonuclease